MDKTELYTLIFGIILISFLIFLYYSYKIRKNRIIKFIVKGDKKIKRMHYILKKNGFRIYNVNKTLKFNISLGDRFFQNKYNIIAMAQKANRNYLCFLNVDIVNDSSLNYELLFKCVTTKFNRCLIINTDNFNLQTLNIYH